jgi:hypothetical protein
VATIPAGTIIKDAYKAPIQKPLIFAKTSIIPLILSYAAFQGIYHVLIESYTYIVPILPEDPTFTRNYRLISKSVAVYLCVVPLFLFAVSWQKVVYADEGDRKNVSWAELNRHFFTFILATITLLVTVFGGLFIIFATIGILNRLVLHKYVSVPEEYLKIIASLLIFTVPVYVAVKVSLAFPSASNGLDIGFLKSWKMTRGIFWKLVLIYTAVFFPFFITIQVLWALMAHYSPKTMVWWADPFFIVLYCLHMAFFAGSASLILRSIEGEREPQSVGSGSVS